MRAAPPSSVPSSAVRGVEPFELIRGDLKNLKIHIKELVERHIGSKDSTREGGTNPLLQEAAREFFERRERAWRPGTVLLMSRALGASEEAAASGKAVDNGKGAACRPTAKQLQLAEIVEMMVTAQVIHDDVLEDLEEGDKQQEAGGGNVAHRMYSSSLGNKVSLLAGDFLLARASVQLAQLTNTEVVGIIGTSLENMCRGEIMHAQANVQDKLSREYYDKKVSLKTASLLADACRCSAVLRGEGSGSDRAHAAWQYGHHLAVAYSLTNEAAAFTALLAPHFACGTEREEEASKTEGGLRGALVACVGLPPFALLAGECGRLRDLAVGEFSGDSDAAEALELLRGGEGEAMALALAHEHSTEARRAALGGLPPSVYRDGLEVLTEYVVEPDQAGLQRAKWQEMQAKANAKLAAAR